MRRVAVTGLGLVVALALGAPLYAQRTTGGIAGTVVDDTGAVLPGVNVSVSGEKVVGSQTAVTNAEGFFRFIGLPPGSYDVTFSLSGFATQKRSGIRVSVGGTVETHVTLNLGDLAEELTVTAEAPVVDTSSNEVGSNYEREWVENAPMPRNSFFDLVAAAPGSLQGGDQSARTMVYGASYDENSFQLDGTDVNDNFFNEALAEPNMDSIEEIEVLSLGAPAEYGNMTGAVYNIVTRQGTNQFHGDVSFYYQRPATTPGTRSRHDSASTSSSPQTAAPCSRATGASTTGRSRRASSPTSSGPRSSRSSSACSTRAAPTWSTSSRSRTTRTSPSIPSCGPRAWTSSS
jgi:hypothetical protein